MALSTIDYGAGQDLMSDAFDKTNAAIDEVNTLAFVGSVVPYFGTAAPNSKYLLCNGQAVSRTTYADLFTLIGTSYGSGNGTTTFNLPNLKGRFLVGYDPGDSDYNALTSAKSGGSKTHTLTVNEIPAHTHSGVVSAGNIAGGGASVAPVSAGNTGSTGGGQPHENRPPYLTVNYLIRALF